MVNSSKLHQYSPVIQIIFLISLTSNVQEDIWMICWLEADKTSPVISF